MPKTKRTKKQHYIAQGVIKAFFDSSNIYEKNVHSGKTYKTSVNNTMCMSDSYEFPLFDDNYLENLFKGLMSTQNISGALQLDQAIKICKISYEIDNRITEGADFDKILASYDKLVRTAEFTPKNTKSAGDFETVGELVHWMEKAGFRAKYYNNVTNDIVDSTLKNVQNFNRNLYINESGIGDEISRRIEALKTVERLDNYYDIGNNSEDELDKFDNEGIDNLLKDNEEFEVDLDD